MKKIKKNGLKNERLVSDKML